MQLRFKLVAPSVLVSAVGTGLQQIRCGPESAHFTTIGMQVQRILCAHRSN